MSAARTREAQGVSVTYVLSYKCYLCPDYACPDYAAERRTANGERRTANGERSNPNYRASPSRGRTEHEDEDEDDWGE